MNIQNEDRLLARDLARWGHCFQSIRAILEADAEFQKHKAEFWREEIQRLKGIQCTLDTPEHLRPNYPQPEC